MSFENYECDGQLSFDDLYPKQCCGLNPWLHKTKCWMNGRDDLEQEWLMYYIARSAKRQRLMILAEQSDQAEHTNKPKLQLLKGGMIQGADLTATCS